MQAQGTHILEVHFTLTRDDFWHLQLHAYARRRSTQIKALVFYGAILVIATVALKSAFLFIAGVAFAILLFAVAYLNMWITATKGAQSLRNRGNNTVTISDEGVRQKNDQSDSLTRWSAIKAVDTDAYDIYLQLDNPSRVFIATIIPKRAFENVAAADQFVEAVRAYRQAQPSAQQ